MNEKDIHREVENSLSSLDELKHAKTDPFFFTRLQARLDNKNERTFFGERQLQWILAVLVFLLCMNVFSYITLTNQRNESTRMESLESFASNYGWASYNLYDFNQMEK